MRILVDMDGVTVDMVSKILLELNTEFKTSFKKEHIKDWNFFSENSSYNLLSQKQKEFVRSRLNEPGFCRNLPLIPHVEKTLVTLAKSGCEITWLTAPWKSSKTWIQDRTEMIQEHLSHISTHVVFSWNKEETPGDLLIDDNPEFLLKWLDKNYKPHKKGHQALLFRQPWNIEYGTKNKCEFLDGWKDKKLAHTLIAHRILR